MRVSETRGCVSETRGVRRRGRRSSSSRRSRQSPERTSTLDGGVEGVGNPGQVPRGGKGRSEEIQRGHQRRRRAQESGGISRGRSSEELWYGDETTVTDP
eukprot:1565036-Rhodomonas_salina.2